MNKTLILVVEDDRPIRNLIVTTLKTHDYKYLAAENGFFLSLLPLPYQEAPDPHGCNFTFTLPLSEVTLNE